LLVDDIIRTLDAVSLSLYLGQPPGHAIRDLKDLGSAIQNLNEEWRSVFYTELISRTEKLSAPVRPEVPKSRRVQEKLKKQREEVQKSQGTSVRIIRG
jgi:hypothetical protein